MTVREKSGQFETINPATGEVIGSYEPTDAQRVEEILTEAKQVQNEWRKTPLSERTELLETAAKNIEDDLDDFAEFFTAEQGKPISEARGEIENAVKRIRYFSSTGIQALEHETVTVEDGLVEESTIGRIQQRPVGVVAAIKPWNYPVNTSTWSICLSLLAGNTCIYKPSEETTLIGERLIEYFPDELTENGILNLVKGAGRVGRKLVHSSQVDMVSFVGSQPTGEWIYQESSQHIRPLSLELSGMGATVVLPDADREKVIEDVLVSGYVNTGQLCCGTERLYVPEGEEDWFYERLVSEISEFEVSAGIDDPDIAAMVRQIECDRVENHLEDAQEKGAIVFRHAESQLDKPGNWQTPAVLKNVDTTMDVMNEETFGPIVCVDTYRDTNDAIEKVNGTDYGLSAMIYGEDPDELENLSSEINAGSIGINQWVDSVVELPWGGTKKSGLGRLLGKKGILEFTEEVTERWNESDWSARSQ